MIKFLNYTFDVLLYFTGITIFKKTFDIQCGMDAVNYYSEVHHSTGNCLLHTFMIPLAVYYFYSGVPKLVCMTKGQANNFVLKTNLAVFLMYFLELNWFATIKTICLYSPSLVFFLQNKEYSEYALLKATGIMILTELIGHTLFEKEQSRGEGIVNAILYSHYFNANHLNRSMIEY